MLQDVAEKLCLPSADDAEYICAKAIRDGGIDAVVDHEGGFLATREVTDLYSTNEPQVGQTAVHWLTCFRTCCECRQQIVHHLLGIYSFQRLKLRRKLYE